MIYSMTGFSAMSRDSDHGTVTLELRSVNSRYLDLAFRIAEDLRAVEPALRELLGARVSRGKIECRVAFQAAHGLSPETAPNEAVLRQLAGWQDLVRRVLPEARSLSVAEVLQWQGVFEERQADRGALQAECLTLARDALDDFLATRAREGARLAAMIRERAALMRQLVEKVEPRIPALVAEFQERMAQRLREAMASVDEDRVRQEVSLFAARADIAEEVSRLAVHLTEVERILDKGGVVGKRLDFLMQELNREANTLASKAMASDVTATAVELKLLVEQMREQVQNIE